MAGRGNVFQRLANVAERVRQTAERVILRRPAYSVEKPNTKPYHMDKRGRNAGRWAIGTQFGADRPNAADLNSMFKSSRSYGASRSFGGDVLVVITGHTKSPYPGKEESYDGGDTITLSLMLNVDEMDQALNNISNRSIEDIMNQVSDPGLGVEWDDIYEVDVVDT